MSLTPEQKASVSLWVAAGDNLSAVQKKITEQFKFSMTYRDVRFLVDDLNLELKDPAPKVDASDVSKTPPPVAKAPGPSAQPAGIADAAAESPADAEAELADDGLEDLPPGASSVTVEVDKVTLIPGALAAGTVTFSDGVTGKWVIDQQYRPGFTEISQPGYRPTPADSQAFMQQLSAQLQKRGF
ncbi:MAG: hypothetical protein ACKVVO_12860 [Opitutaceae bacterium]|jgi:hypothetical protein